MYFGLAQHPLWWNWILYILFQMDLYCNGWPKLDVGLQEWSYIFKERRITLLDLLVTLLLGRMLLAAFATRTCCWLVFTLLPTRTSGSLSVELFPRELAPRLYRGQGYSADAYLFLLNFMRFLSSHFSTLSTSLWAVALPSSILSAHPSSVFCADLLGVHCVPSPRLLMKTLNSIRPPYWSLKVPT